MLYIANLYFISNNLKPSLMRLSALGALLLLLVMAGCKDKQPKIPAYNPKFSEYVSSFTSGVISKKSNIEIYFATSLGDSSELADKLNDELLEFEPEIEGQLVRAGQTGLRFIPNEDLVPGQVYKASLALNKLMQVPDSLGTFEFGFQVLRPAYEWGNVWLVAQPEDQMTWYRLRGSVLSADDEELEDVKQILSVKLNGKEQEVSWLAGEQPRQYIFEIDSLERQEEEQKISISVNKDAPGTAKLESREELIPSLNNFKFLGHNIVQQPSQHIRINFSDPIQKDQDLSGLITLENADDLRVEIENTSILVYPKESVYGSRTLKIFPGIKNIRGIRFKDEKELELEFRNEKPQVAVIGDGNIIPLNDKLMLPFMAISLSAVDVKVVKIPQSNVMQFLQTNQLDGESELYRVGEIVARKKIDLKAESSLKDWNNYSLDLSELMKPEPGGIYRVYFSFQQEYSLYECNDDQEVEQEEDDDYWYYEDDYYYYDNSDQSAYDRDDYYFRYPRGYRWDERDNPCHVSYYHSSRFVTRNVMASNLGLIAKRTENGQMDFTVNHLTDNKPVSGAEIGIYNYQGRKIQSVSTDKNGWAEIEVKGRPYFAVAEKDDHKTYLKLQEGLALSVSEFEVSGQEVAEGIKGFVYGERGGWRPGDTIFLSFILEDQGNPLPEGHPIHFELVDPRGMVVDKQVKSKADKRIYAFTTRTSGSAPTGNYTARIRVGDRNFSERVRVETVKPNRLDIGFELENDVLDLSDGQPLAKLSVDWLTGIPSANSQVQINAFISKASNPFPKYTGYQFQDLVRDFTTTEKQVLDDKVGEDGKATFTLGLDQVSEAPGMLQGRFVVKAFEGGGEFSTEVFDAKIAPYDRFVGMKMPKPTDSYFLETDRDYDLQVMTLDQAGKPVNANNLEVKVYRIDYHWWYNRQGQNLARYVNNEVNHLISEGTVSTVNGMGTYKLKVKYPAWGRMLVRVCDPESGHCTSSYAYFDWPAGRKGNRPELAGVTLLNFFTEKEKYQIGEEVVARIPADEGTRVLVSIENGSGILSKHWVDPKDGVAEFKMKATPEMAPNVYISASLLQPHAQTKNDRPMRLYGVVPVEVYDPATKLQPVIEAKEVWRPETEVSVKVMEKEGRAMQYTLAIVDDGLLNLTAFKTPKPWDHFYAKEALGVKTWDMYNDVLGAFGGRLEKVFSIGGDEALAKMENSNLNRFKPMVRYLGPFKLKKGATAEHKIKIPNYIGSVRVMVVAADDNRAYGHADKNVKVRKPLMVLNTLPRMLSPGDEVQLPVTVFAMEDQVRDVNVRVKVNGKLQLVGESQKKVSFSKNGEKVVNFSLKVPEERGEATVRVEATSGSEKAYDETELKVRIPSPPQTRFSSFVLKAGRDTVINYEPLGVEQTNSLEIEASTIPPLNINQHLHYLFGYPHGCTEQKISAAFPALYLEDLMELSDEMKLIRDQNIRIAIQYIQERQYPSGGIRYWPKGNIDDYVTSYAGHFLHEASQKGYDIPAGVMSRWESFQKSRARNWHPGVYYSRAYSYMEQAYRLYTLAVVGEAEIGAMNRFREYNDMPVTCMYYLSAAYSLAGQKQAAMEAEQKAKALEEGPFYYRSWYYGGALRNESVKLMALKDIGKESEALQQAREVAKMVNKNTWYTTHDLAFALKSLLTTFGDNTQDSKMRWSFAAGSEKYNYSEKWTYDIYDAKSKLDEPHEIRISNNSSVPVNYVLTRTGIPIDYDLPAISKGVQLDVQYTYPTGESIDISSIKQGQDFMAIVTVTRGNKEDAYENMALTQLMPTGWEIINTRLLEVDEEGESGYEYRDIRDDRVYTYFDLNYRWARTAPTKTFKVRLNATYAGRFYLPPVEVYDMYNEEVIAREPGRWVEVGKE